MKIIKLFLLGLFGTFLLNSCSSDDDVIDDNPEIPEEDYSDGFFVLNEGGTGTVTYISNDLETVEQNIYASVNEGDDIGQYAQSMFFDDDLAYIISNGSNLITVVDRYTFELVGKVESGLEVPMYGVVENGKAYVTNLAGFDSNTDDFIAVINLESLEVEETIPVNDHVNYITEEDGLLYVLNTSFGSGNHISVLNPTTNSLENTVEVNEGVNSIAIEDNTLYALSSDRLEKIDLGTFEISEEIIFEELSGVGSLDVEDGVVYFTVGTSVYAMGADEDEAPEEALLSYDSDSDFGVMYGFEVEEGRIYIADGGDFASDSFVEIYTSNGEFLETIEVGVGPNGFYFND